MSYARTPFFAALALALASPLALVGCAESNSTDPLVHDSGSTADTNAGADTGTPSDSTTPTDAGSDVAVVPGAVVINELRMTGGDYIELFNTSAAAVDLTGWTIEGTKSDGTSNAYVFPSGTSITGHGFLLVVYVDPDAGAPGPTAMCEDAGVTRCIGTLIKVSNSRAEPISLLNASGQLTSLATTPTPDAGLVIPSGQTLGRLPDGTGDWVANRPTPGAPNQAP